MNARPGPDPSDAAREAGAWRSGIARRRAWRSESKRRRLAGHQRRPGRRRAADASSLRAARPDYGWLSEETADDPRPPGRRRACSWSIPIDGTAAFMKGRPWWSVSIAVVEDGLPVAGVVHAPQARTRPTAPPSAGGATRNGEPIRPSDDRGPRGLPACWATPMVFGHPAWPEPWPPMRVEQPQLHRLPHVPGRRWRAFDAAVALSPKNDWDLAAADLICPRGRLLRRRSHRPRVSRYNRRQIRRSRAWSAPRRRFAPLILERVGHIGAATTISSARRNSPRTP